MSPLLFVMLAIAGCMAAVAAGTILAFAAILAIMYPLLWMKWLFDRIRATIAIWPDL